MSYVSYERKPISSLDKDKIEELAKNVKGKFLLYQDFHYASEQMAYNRHKSFLERVEKIKAKLSGEELDFFNDKVLTKIEKYPQGKIVPICKESSKDAEMLKMDYFDGKLSEVYMALSKLNYLNNPNWLVVCVPTREIDSSYATGGYIEISLNGDEYAEVSIFVDIHMTSYRKKEQCFEVSYRYSEDVADKEFMSIEELTEFLKEYFHKAMVFAHERKVSSNN